MVRENHFESERVSIRRKEVLKNVSATGHNDGKRSSWKLAGHIPDEFV